MQLFPFTVVMRHRRENLKKCSLQGLESYPDFFFFSYPCQHLPEINFSNYVLLSFDGPPLTFEKDAHSGLFILDATWRHANKMLKFVEDIPHLEQRSIPAHFRTAYPRRQEDCALPERGLASIEAIFVAYKILKRDTSFLLENYYWKDQFLEKNKKYLES
jgi:pre-rRNA-processing protein TSR3